MRLYNSNKRLPSIGGGSTAFSIAAVWGFPFFSIFLYPNCNPMKYFLLSLLLVGPLSAQIHSERHLFHTRYYEGDRQLSPAQLRQRLESNPSSVQWAQQAHRQLRPARWLQGAGTLVLGVQTAHWVSNGNTPKWQWSLPALGTLGFSISLERKGRMKQQQALQRFNQQFKNKE